MGSKRGKRGRVVSPAAQEKLRQHETARLVNSLIYKGDLVGLRKVARARGLAADSLRARAWPFLLSGGGQKGCGQQDSGAMDCATATLPDAEYLRLAGQQHRDSQVVLVDAERSLFKYTRSYPDEDRRALQQALMRLLNATINSYPEEHVFYYQGLHDIASVLLLVVGEAGAFRLLRKLVVGHLRDASRASLDAVVQLLPLLTWILRELDPPIADLIEQSGTPPFYCLSWFLTWFSHDLDSLRACSRLFDVFLASHPLLPLYVGAVAMHSHRQRLLQCSTMPELHTALVNLPITAVLGVDELCWRSLRLFHDTPPPALLRASGLRMVHATAPEAHLTAAGICLPDKPVLEHGQVPQTVLQGVMGDYQRSITSGPPRGNRVVAVAAVALASVGVAVAASVISMYASQKALGPALLQ